MVNLNFQRLNCDDEAKRQTLFRQIDWDSPFSILQNGGDFDRLDFEFVDDEVAAVFYSDLEHFMVQMHFFSQAGKAELMGNQYLALCLDSHESFLFQAYLCGSGFQFSSRSEHYLDVFTDMWHERFAYIVLFPLAGCLGDFSALEPIEISFNAQALELA